jgi:hypothetical protein
MVDHEAGRRAEAARAEPPAVSVPGKDEQISLLSGPDDLSFRAAASLQAACRAPQSLRGSVKEFGGCVGSERFEPRARIRIATSQQASERAAGESCDVAISHMEQHDISAGQQGISRINARRPGSLGHPDNHGHGSQPPRKCATSPQCHGCGQERARRREQPRQVNSPRSFRHAQAHGRRAAPGGPRRTFQVRFMDD